MYLHFQLFVPRKYCFTMWHVINVRFLYFVNASRKHFLPFELTKIKWSFLTCYNKIYTLVYVCAYIHVHLMPSLKYAQLSVSVSWYWVLFYLVWLTSNRKTTKHKYKLRTNSEYVKLFPQKAKLLHVNCCCVNFIDQADRKPPAMDNSLQKGDSKLSDNSQIFIKADVVVSGYSLHRLHTHCHPICTVQTSACVNVIKSPRGLLNWFIYRLSEPFQFSLYSTYESLSEILLCNKGVKVEDKHQMQMSTIQSKRFCLSASWHLTYFSEMSEHRCHDSMTGGDTGKNGLTEVHEGTLSPQNKKNVTKFINNDGRYIQLFMCEQLNAPRAWITSHINFSANNLVMQSAAMVTWDMTTCVMPLMADFCLMAVLFRRS